MSQLSQELSLLFPTWNIVESTAMPVASGGGHTQLVQMNPLRWGVIFSLPPNPGSTAWVLIATQTATLDANTGLSIPDTGGMLEFWYRRHAALCQQAWYAVGMNGTPQLPMTVIEILAQQ